MKERLKRLLFTLLGKEPDGIVVSFWSGEDPLAARMVEEIRELVPDRRHFTVRIGQDLAPGSAWSLYRQLRRRFRRYRIALAPVLFTPKPHPLRAAAFLLAPGKILAYNARLERHHLRLRAPVASALFFAGVPLDRIWLRPKWLVPWKADRSVAPATYRVIEGRPFSPGRRRVAVLSPYFPYPLSHGGAVRIFNLLRETSREFDVLLFAFGDQSTEVDIRVIGEFCNRIILVPQPRYREPRWSTLLPPEVHEFDAPGMRNALERFRADYDLLQVEYTHLAPYGGDILVEHDVTFDLFRQVEKRERTGSARWNLARWRRFETRAVGRFRRVVVMSEKDARLLDGIAHTAVIENGVDLERFLPEPERPGQRLLFVGSFRHFPNVAAYRWFMEEVWPHLRAEFPEMQVTVVGGPDHLACWQAYTGEAGPPADDRVRLLGFVADVRPLYVEANLVIVPTVVSAGTNLKVLEAMAMERAVVSTSSGCAGLGLVHGESVWVADSPADFGKGVAGLVGNGSKRRALAEKARRLAVQRFGWSSLGEKQRALYRELLTGRRNSARGAG